MHRTFAIESPRDEINRGLISDRLSLRSESLHRLLRDDRDLVIVTSIGDAIARRSSTETDKRVLLVAGNGIKRSSRGDKVFVGEYS